MHWLALAMEVNAEGAEAFGDALLEAGACSVALEPAAAERERHRLTVLVAPDTCAPTLVLEAAQRAGLEPPGYAEHRVEDEDWVMRSRAQLAPLALGRLWIGPTWIDAPAAAQAAVRIDPGLAFGTGSHPSTRLILQFLERTLRGSERVLDYGCGSGILAIAAAKLGAARVDAVDIDPLAVETASANAAANGVAIQVALPGALPPALYEMVLANILAQPLIVLAPLLASRSARGGLILLSGVLDSQAEEVAGAYAESFRVRPRASEEGWTLLVGVRK